MADTCSVVMPVFNEAACIESVCLEWLGLLEERGLGSLLVVDDGSTDGTPAILGELSGRHARLRVVRQPNGGHGRAVLHGYRLALASGCDWILQMDSDGQFRAADFDLLWSRRNLAGFILGYRAERHDPWIRKALSEVHRRLVQGIFGVSVRDPNVPFRLMRASLLARFLELMPGEAFAPNVFLSILAAVGGVLLEVPVQHLPRQTGKASIRGWKTLRIAYRCFSELVAFRHRGAPP